MGGHCRALDRRATPLGNNRLSCRLTYCVPMKARFLEITYRNGKAIAAYLYLPRQMGDRSVRTKRLGGGLVIDLADDGRAIGIEVTSPNRATLADLNRALLEANQPELRPDEAAPLLSAA